MKKLLKKLLAGITTAALCVTLASCGGNELNGWKTVQKSASDGVLLEYMAKVQFSSATTSVSEIWCNVSDISGEVSFTVTLTSYDSTSNQKEITTKVNSATLKQSQDGWINVLKSSSGNYNRAIITTCDTMSLNEIIFIGSDGKILEASFMEGGVRPSGTTSSGNIYDADKLASLSQFDPAYSEYPAYNIVDEQGKFPEELIITGK